MTLVRVLLLALRAHAAYPHADPVDLARVSYVAVAAETYGVPAELLVVIAEHESDLQPGVVSYRARGRRVDRICPSDVRGAGAARGQCGDIPASGPMTCGMFQTVAHGRAECAALMDPLVAARAAAAELGEWTARARGDLGLALAGYAGGNAGFDSWRSGGDGDAVRFARLFAGRARRLARAAAPRVRAAS